jgi:hypothetical protein
VSPVKYELSFYIPEDGILHSHRRENLKSDIYSVLFITLLQRPLSDLMYHSWMIDVCGLWSNPWNK